jgi:tetratricopeptide (TPR) repeat protein
MGYSNYLKEIKELLWSTWYSKEMEDDEFNKIKKELDKLYEETNDPECLWLISELYIHKANSSKRNGMKYALNGLTQDYNNSGLQDNYAVCSDGIMIDFKKRNHYKLIEYYYDFIKIHPDSLIARRILIENLIDNFRFDEAMTEIEEAYKIAGNKIYLIEFYEGEILYKTGYQEKAIEFWKKICERNNDNYVCYFCLAEEYANFGRYDEAIEYYKLSFTMQKSPRKIDGLISMFQIYEIKKDYHEALNTLNLILSVYEKDYGITDGEEIQPYLKDKERIIIHEKLIFS